MPKRILIVDDEPDIVTVMKFTLEKYGFEVITAYNGQEGIKQALEYAPDLIILDVLMPEMPGDVMGHELANHPQTSNIPIIFLTNVPIDFLAPSDEQDDYGLQKDERGNIFLPKMASEELFLEIIHKVLEEHGKNSKL